MRRITPVLLVLIGGLAGTPPSLAQQVSPDGLWTDLGETVVANPVPAQAALFRTFALDESATASALAAAPLEFTGQGAAPLTVPMPDGTYLPVAIQESPILGPDLAHDNPEIRTYKLRGTGEQVITGRIARINSSLHILVPIQAGTLVVEPDPSGPAGMHRSYWTRDMFWPQASSSSLSAGTLACQTSDQESPWLQAGTIVGTSLSGDFLHTYRFAVTATGEFTQTAGGVTEAIHQIAITMSQVNAILERDLSIRLVLAATLIFDDPLTDPFVVNDILQNRSVNTSLLNSAVGENNYDAGHVFAMGDTPRGVADFGSACDSLNKGAAISQDFAPLPFTPAFALNTVSHEVGHQLNAHHTWNSYTGWCSPTSPIGENFHPDSAYEPGSGSTTMAYSNCAPQNVVLSSPFVERYYFHTHSYDEITAFRDGTGACAALVPTGNTPPTVEAGLPCTVPASTPFRLTADGDDLDSDRLSYTWEQYDLGNRQGIPMPSFTTGPMFRSRQGTTDPTRVFPAMGDLLSAVPTTWEVLPSVERTMNFRVTVRDGRGGVDYDSTQVITSGPPFEITAPTAGASITCGAPVDLEWSVGGGDISPEVRVLYSADNGASFSDLVLVANNTGLQSVSLPGPATGQARLMIEPIDGCFFALSDEFSVTQAPDDADCDGIANLIDLCPDYPSANADVDLNGIGDECECGDQNGDGTINVGDILAINLAIFNPEAVTPLCDANDDGLCNVGDILAVNARIFGAATYCARYPRP